jgi:hypothetical protein
VRLLVPVIGALLGHSERRADPESLTGTAPSVGFVHGLLARTAGLLGAVYDRIRALITLAYAVCCDETPLRVGPRTPVRRMMIFFACSSSIPPRSRTPDSYHGLHVPPAPSCDRIDERRHLRAAKDRR